MTKLIEYVKSVKKINVKVVLVKCVIRSQLPKINVHFDLNDIVKHTFMMNKLYYGLFIIFYNN